MSKNPDSTATQSGNTRRAKLAADRAAAAKKAQKRKAWIIGSSILVGALVILLSVWAIMNAQAKKEVTSKPVGAVGTEAISLYPGKAKAGAPIVTVYSDYQCPFCKVFEEALGEEFNKLAENGDIDFQVRTLTFIEDNFPGNKWSTRAAEAAACAGISDVNMYPEVFSAIYAFQPEKEGAGYTDEALTTDVPAKAGMTGKALEAYQKCYKNRDTEGFVRAVDTAGRKSIEGIETKWGTPLYAVNGKKLKLTDLYDNATKTWNSAGLLDLIKAG
ncbi:MAG: DsbA family protein [Propionibacteriaceae bacterium]